MNLKKIIIISGLTLFTVGVGVYSSKLLYNTVSENAIQEVNVFKLKKDHISETLVAPINFIRTEKMNMVYPEYNLLQKVIVKQGDIIRQGDKIIELDKVSLEKAIKDIEIEIAELEKLQSESIEILAQKLKKAEDAVSISFELLSKKEAEYQRISNYSSGIKDDYILSRKQALEKTKDELYAIEQQVIEAELLYNDGFILEEDYNRYIANRNQLKDEYEREESLYIREIKPLEDDLAKCEQQLSLIEVELANAKAAYELAVSNYEILKLTIEQPQKDNTSEAIEGLKNKINELEIKINDPYVYSNIEGTVIEVNLDYIQNGEKMVYIETGDNDSLIGELSTTRSISGKLKPGSEITININGKDYLAYVQSSETIKLNTVLVRVGFKDDVWNLNASGQIEASITIAEKEGAYIIPSDVLVAENGPTKQIYIIDENGTARSINVTTGINEGENIEIISPELKENMNVVSDYNEVKIGYKYKIRY